MEPQHDTVTTGAAVDLLAMAPLVTSRVESYYAEVTSALGAAAGLAKSDAQGRHLVARRDLKAGTPVWSGEPYAAITDAQRSLTHCAYCFQPAATQLLRCSRCKLLRYCNTECQRKDWAAVHKEECGMIQSVAPHKPTSSMLLMWRVLIRRIKEEQEGKSLPNFDLIRYLTTHFAAFPSEKKEHFGVMAALIKKSLPVTLPTDITPQEIMHLFCLFACNNFTVSDGELKPLGLGIYPPAALINHSCDPNCVIIFEGRQCTVRSLRDITKDEEITFNYVEVGDPTETRRRELMDNFFFHCTCPRCQANLPEVTPAPKGVNEQNELRRAAKYDREGAEAKKTGDLVLARKKYKRAFKIRRSLLLAHDPLLGFNLNELMNLCISLAPNVGEAAWREALLYCSASLAVFERMYPPRWPLVGLQYLIHGKLSFYLKYTEAALESMQRALPILTITHGSGHPLVHTLHIMLAEATAEWNYEKDHNPRLHRLLS